MLTAMVKESDEDDEAISASCLLERMQSHIGCICLIFLQCVLSNVSSNCPPKRMHSRIGYMYNSVSPQVAHISIFNIHSYIGPRFKEKITPMSTITGNSKPLETSGRF